jgi:TPR repeat protein
MKPRSTAFHHRPASILALLVSAMAFTLMSGSKADAQFVAGELPTIEAPPPPSIYDVLAASDRSPRGTARNSVPADQLYELGQRFWQGTDVPKDPSETAYWLKLVVISRLGPKEQNALNLLAYLHANGDGSKTDPAAARLLWELSAAGGNGTAMYNLGYMYENGVGIPASRDRARSWYERAREAGYEKAQAALDRLKK